MPSIAELCCLYRSKDVLNSVLNALEVIRLYSKYYWSSSQNGYYGFFAWLVNFSDGYVDANNKNGSYGGVYVCCVRAFN